MRTVLLASLRTHTRRYAAATLAVIIGVAFIVTTNALASGARAGMVSGIDAPYRGAEVVVSEIGGDTAKKILRQADRQGADASVLGWAWLPVSKDGKQITDGTDVGALADEASLQWQELTAGRLPKTDDEAVVDTNAAKGNGVRIGDVLTVGSGRNTHDVTVVGTVDSPSALVWCSIYVTEAALVEHWLDEAMVDSVAWAGKGSVDEQIAALAASHPDAVVQTPDDYVDGQHQRATQGVDVIALVLLLFAGIALLTSVLVIANTFSILFAQRTKDFALLRCVGATRRQVLGSIRMEALVLGVVASLLGLLAGTGIGFGLVELIQAVAPGARMGGAEMSPVWYAAAFLTGVLITLAASWLPTRKATRVSPLAALRPDTGIDARTASGRLQLLLGIALVASGIAGLAAAMAGSSVPLMLLGGAATSVGVLILGPRIVPALISLIGGLAGRVIGAPARLAAQNAVRNPRRTAATTASLLIGVTLTTAVLTGLATARSEVDREMDVDHPVDATITAVGGNGIDAEMASRAGDLDDVDEVLKVPGTVGEVEGIADLTVLAPSPSATLLRSRPMFATPDPDAIFLPYNLIEGVELTERVTLTVGDRSRTLTLNTGDDWGDAALVAPETLAALTDRPSTQALWLRTDASADAKDLGGDLEAIAGGAEVFSTLEKRAYVDLQLNVLAGAIVGLLGIAIVIALVGIANTLGLSVLERARENALLRALGLTRRQLRATLAVEAVLLSVVATVMGVTLGVAFAWVGVETMLSQFVDDLSMTLPWGQLALVIVVSAVAGLLACVLPARRAARVTPAAGLTMD